MKLSLFLILITSFIFSENNLSFKTQLVSEGFSRPLLVRFHPETNSMFVIEQTGKIKFIEKNKITTFIDLSDLVLCNAGSPVFDLSQNETLILGTQDPNDFNISYHIFLHIHLHKF